MQNENEPSGDDKRPYNRPTLIRYPLRAEEAVLGFCKSASTRGPNVGNCKIPSPCSSTGS